ncbi:flagellar hook-basal body protein [Niallia endozanthoxylica]|uniref:Flagellar hook-basal body protein n=1 Tax=Niallia endozanthoxylica TaxID=2036016 RepID=A0A5J5I2M0_9BACI|nr:flagellar hook-basal body protein [Niallia endozanthoxylica]KAA9027800.1 flagellar hook-basal body protein [Niallia endozanthoxylica]
MLRGFYTAASGMLAQQRRTEMLANNMANANTPGFKADQTSLRAFPEMLLSQIKEQSFPAGQKNVPTSYNPIGALNTGVYLQETMPFFQQGTLKETTLSTDVSLVDINLPINQNTGSTGSVFFTIANANGEIRYTRNGNFTLDSEGYLTTGSGQYVLDQQRNRIQLSSSEFEINEDGYITGANGETARLGIGYSDNPMSMVKEGDGLFRAEGELADAYTAAGVMFKMQQGYLEQSNVNTAQTMTDMMTAYRAFEANQKILQAYDTSLQKTVNEVGRIG